MFIILAIPSVTSWIVHESGSRRSVGRPLRGGAAAEPGTGLGQRLDDALVDLWDLSVRDQDWITGDAAQFRTAPAAKDGRAGHAVCRRL